MNNVAGRMPAKPTKAKAGTLRKMAVMRGRLRRGELLFHPDDNPECGGNGGKKYNDGPFHCHLCGRLWVANVHDICGICRHERKLAEASRPKGPLRKRVKVVSGGAKFGNPEERKR